MTLITSILVIYQDQLKPNAPILLFLLIYFLFFCPSNLKTGTECIVTCAKEEKVFHSFHLDKCSKTRGQLFEINDVVS